jgi:hypothetical protein
VFRCRYTPASEKYVFAEKAFGLINRWRKWADMGVKRIYPAHGKPFSIENLLKKIDM